MAVITKTLKTSGGDYSNIETWNSTEQTNLVTDGDSHVLEISAGTFTTATTGLSLAAWTAGASNRITIKAAAGDEHDGVRNSGAIIECTSATAADTTFAAFNYTTIQDVTLKQSGSTQKRCLRPGTAVLAEGEGFIAQRLILDGGAVYALYINGFVLTITVAPIVRNCMIYGGMATATNYEQLVLQNITLTGTAEIIIRNNARSAASKIQNVYANTWTYTNAGAYGTITTNAANDTTAPGSSPVNSVSTTDGVNFTAPSTNDYTLTSGSALVNTATDLSGTFTDDIKNATRSAWDIGAYEYIAAGLTVPEIMAMTRRKNTPLIAM